MAAPVCIVLDCSKKQMSLGFCWKHYEIWKTGESDLTPFPVYCKHCGGEVPIRPGPRDYCDAGCKKAARSACGFQGCTKPIADSGLCSGHVAQLRAGRELVPLRDWSPSCARDELGRKRCSVCKQWLPVDRFNIDRQTSDGLSTYCQTCARWRNIATRFSITPQQYQELFDRQGGVCLICGDPPGERPLAADHDHACCPGKMTCGKCIRALLCGGCNSAIGLMREDPQILRNALEYLRRHRATR